MKRQQSLDQDSVAELIRIIEGPQHPNRQGFDPFALDEMMDRFGIPGVSIAVIKDFKIHWAKGYGIADVETGAPVDTETLFQAASISKPVTAMAVLKAVQDGNATKTPLVLTTRMARQWMRNGMSIRSLPRLVYGPLQRIWRNLPSKCRNP